MEFRISGPSEALTGEGPLDFPGGKQRALPALLLVNAGRVVAADRIVDELWGEHVAETAPKMVQIFVSQLRKRLPAGMLRRGAPGYVLALDGLELRLARLDDRIEADLRLGRHRAAS